MMRYVNEPPEGKCANAVAIPLYLPKGNAIAYYACKTIAPHTEIWTHYGPKYKRDYKVGLEGVAPRKIQRADDVLHRDTLKKLDLYCARRR